MKVIGLGVTPVLNIRDSDKKVTIALHTQQFFLLEHSPKLCYSINRAKNVPSNKQTIRRQS